MKRFTVLPEENNRAKICMFLDKSKHADYITRYMMF